MVDIIYQPGSRTFTHHAGWSYRATMHEIQALRATAIVAHALGVDPVKDGGLVYPWGDLRDPLEKIRVSSERAEIQSMDKSTRDYYQQLLESVSAIPEIQEKRKDKK